MTTQTEGERIVATWPWSLGDGEKKEMSRIAAAIDAALTKAVAETWDAAIEAVNNIGLPPPKFAFIAYQQEGIVMAKKALEAAKESK